MTNPRKKSCSNRDIAATVAAMHPAVRDRFVAAGGAKEKGVTGSRHADKLENPFAQQMKLAGLPEPTREHVFGPPRKFRFDFCWPDKKVAVEIEGGIWTNGAHTRGKHYESDCEKYNLATSLGWAVYRFTEKHIKNGSALATVEAALKGTKE